MTDRPSAYRVGTLNPIGRGTVPDGPIIGWVLRHGSHGCGRCTDRSACDLCAAEAKTAEGIAAVLRRMLRDRTPRPIRHQWYHALVAVILVVTLVANVLIMFATIAARQ